MKKVVLIAAFMLLCVMIFTVKSFAGLASPFPVQIMQADRTVITVILQGDEYVKWAKTTDGYSLLYNKNGIYEYAKHDLTGNMVPSGIKARNVSERNIFDLAFLVKTPKSIYYSQNQLSYLKQIVKIYKSAEATTAFPTIGSAKLLCILIGFSDMAFTITQSEFNDMFNQVGYSANSGVGSVKDYFEEASYGQMDLTTDVVGPYTASKEHKYYGQNSTIDPYYDLHPDELVEEAVNAAVDDVDFADYDNDGDGNVDAIYIIHAGYNEAEGGGANCIWYHKSSISADLDGVHISTYSISAEFRGDSGSGMSRIGNVCHEFGHAMGAPDFYDTDYEENGQYSGTGRWDVMASGNFNGDRASPSHFNPFIKTHYFGWATPTTLNAQANLTLLNSTFNPGYFYMYNTATAGEFFLFENRQLLGFDAELPGHGLLIYHVHKDILSGKINIKHPQKFYPVCANAGTEPTGETSYGNIDSEDTPFPGAGGKTEFTDATVPSAKSWAGANTGKPVAQITEDVTAHTINLCFLGCPPIADFTANIVTPCTATTVSFTDQSTYSPTSWAWSFSPETVTYTGGTSAESQNPKVIFNAAGNYSVTLTATNAYGSDSETKTDYIVVSAAPTVAVQPSGVAAQWGDDVSFTSTAVGPPDPTIQWQLSTDGGNVFKDIVGKTNTTLSLSCITLAMSGYQYQAVFTNRCGTATSDPALLTVTPKLVTAGITVIPNPQQYSDLVTIDVKIPGGYTCGEAAAEGADIYIGTQFMGSVIFIHSGTDLTASLINIPLLEPTPFGTDPTGQMAPGDHEVTAVLKSPDDNYMIANPGTTLTIKCEDAIVINNGYTYFTSNPNSGEGNVALSAYVKDKTDGYRGDIRNADVTFHDGSLLGPVLGSTTDVGLVTPNTWEGTVTTDLLYTLTNGEKAGGGKTWTVWAEAGGYYCGSTAEATPITLAMPGQDFVTGGGFIMLPSNSSGMYAGEPGEKMHFGFVMKWNKSGKNLQGNVNIIYQRDDGEGLKNYQIKSNAINSLVIENVNNTGIPATGSYITYRRAVITTKATLKRIYANGTEDPLGGGLTLIVTAWESTMVKTGELDRISVQLAAPGGSGIYFSSSWISPGTQWMTLNGGNINVRNNGTSSEIAPQITETDDNLKLEVYPNPALGPVNFKFTLSEPAKVTIDIYNANGILVERLLEMEVAELTAMEAVLKKQLPRGMYMYRFTYGTKVITGKFIKR